MSASEPCPIKATATNEGAWLAEVRYVQAEGEGRTAMTRFAHRCCLPQDGPAQVRSHPVNLLVWCKSPFIGRRLETSPPLLAETPARSLTPSHSLLPFGAGSKKETLALRSVARSLPLYFHTMKRDSWHSSDTQTVTT